MMQVSANEVALLTPPGTGAIAVIRITGADAGRIGAELIRLRRAGDVPPMSNELRFGKIVDATETIDDAVVRAVSDGRASGFELCVHGGVRVVQRIFEAAERRGARVVERPSAAETWPAPNAVVAEVLEFLPYARTSRAARFLLAQREAIPRAVQALRGRVAPGVAANHVAAWLARGRAAQRLIHGVSVAIVGPPNVGKSQLFNALVGREASIVSEHRGTTRDWVTADVEIEGVVVRLIDTAGRHATPDALEKLAIDRTCPALQQIAASILVVERDHEEALDAWAEFVPPGTSTDDVVRVSNKWDDEESLVTETTGPRAIRASALVGHGLTAVREAVADRLGLVSIEESLPTLFTERQIRLGARAIEAFRRADSTAWDTVLSIVGGVPA